MAGKTTTDLAKREETLLLKYEPDVGRNATGSLAEGRLAIAKLIRYRSRTGDCVLTPKGLRWQAAIRAKRGAAHPHRLPIPCSHCF